MSENCSICGCIPALCVDKQSKGTYFLCGDCMEEVIIEKIKIQEGLPSSQRGLTTNTRFTERSKRMYWHKSQYQMRGLIETRDRTIRELKGIIRHSRIENDGLKNNLRVIQTTNDELRNTVMSLRKLAHDYITAYEKLVFEDALLTAEEQEDE